MSFQTKIAAGNRIRIQSTKLNIFFFSARNATGDNKQKCFIRLTRLIALRSKPIDLFFIVVALIKAVFMLAQDGPKCS